MTFKLLGQKRFSLIIFGWSQIFIDLQPLAAMLGAPVELHGFSHTFAGATLIGLGLIVIGPWLVTVTIRLIKFLLPGISGSIGLVNESISWTITIVSAFIGVWSHILLDDIMHSDVYPFHPLSNVKPFFQTMSMENLYLACFIIGVVSLSLWLMFRKMFNAKK